MSENIERNQTHYDVEDVPDMTQDGVALGLWRAQISELAPLEAAAEEMVQAQALLSRVHGFAERKGLDKLKVDVEAVWGKVQALYAVLARYEGAVQGAGTVIEAIDGQREEVAAELAAIVDALQGEGWHDLVTDYAQDVIDDEAEMLHEYAFMSVADEASLNLYDMLFRMGGDAFARQHHDFLYRMLHDGILPRLDEAAVAQFVAALNAMNPPAVEAEAVAS